ncbi:MAG TPA: FAD-dependent oxidoreductase [Hyphomicrobiales bacterium]|nr:FAD-dependent oxidoreductase [Hyphomicrobiales bacterium]
MPAERRLATSVLIVGAGPVGLTLALDLAWRGVDSVVIEERGADVPATPRANHVSARAMETYRRLGIAADIRRVGLPDDYPTDVVWATSMTGYELTRIRLPARRDAGGPGYADSGWPTPEPQHKINQMYLEPILRRYAEANPRVRVLYSTRFDGVRQDAGRVVGQATDLDTGEVLRTEAAYLVGCDGGASGIRKAIGATFSGDPAITRVVSLHISAPDLVKRLNGTPAHRYFVVGEQMGSTVTLDGRELWSLHVMLPEADSDPRDLDRDRAVRALTGLDGDLSYRILSEDAWTGRRLLADRFRDGRVFICGDAAHIWVPNAGYGMNAGIADAENLAWRLAAVLRGWGGPSLLDGYERERHPITDQVSRFAKDLAVKNRAADFRRPPAELTRPGPAGDALRRRVGEALYALNRPQFTPTGLNFAYFYDASPNIAYDGEDAPAYGLGDYQASTVPGCRTPHFFGRDGASLYDRLGAGFTLLRLDPSLDAAPLLEAAKATGMPLAVLDLDRAEAGAAYRHDFVLSRPDRHVAWRGDALPERPQDLVGLVSGQTLAERIIHVA